VKTATIRFLTGLPKGLHVPGTGWHRPAPCSGMGALEPESVAWGGSVSTKDDPIINQFGEAGKHTLPSRRRVHRKLPREGVSAAVAAVEETGDSWVGGLTLRE
jgi:hypothetical protein